MRVEGRSGEREGQHSAGSRVQWAHCLSQLRLEPAGSGVGQGGSTTCGAVRTVEESGHTNLGWFLWLGLPSGQRCY